MKQLLPPANATFNAAAKTITFATTIPSTISHILHVTNVTQGVIYFQPQGGSALTGTYASPVLTLAASTTGHANGDKLEIFYDDNLTTLAVTGTVTANAGSGTQAVSLATAPTTPVTGTFFQATQPISAATLPLATGASTATKQPAIGTAGSASADVITVQGVTSMTALKTDSSATVQPVSGTITANAGSGTLAVSLATAPSTPVTGTFWQATQAVSLASAPLPTGAATAANQQNNALTDAQLRATAVPVSGSFTVTGSLTNTELRASAVPVSLATAPTTPVTGTFWQATQPVSGTVTANAGTGTMAVSAAALPLPTGAATAAKQPALGTAGTASADVLTVQGKAAMTPLLTDGSATTQPVSGTVTSNVGTGTRAVSGTFWQATQPVSLATAPTTPVTGTFWQATQPVSIATAPTTPVTGTFWQATQPVSGTVTANAGSGTMAVSLASVPSHAVTNAGTFATQATLAAQPGTANSANSQVTASTTAGTLAVARATRRRVLIKNMDAAITVYVGSATVTSSNGFPLLAGESVALRGQILYQVIAASGTPTVAICDEYD